MAYHGGLQCHAQEPVSGCLLRSLAAQHVSLLAGGSSLVKGLVGVQDPHP